MVVARQRPVKDPAVTPIADLPTRTAALRRIAAEVSGRQDLDGLFRDVIDEAFTLFGVDQAGLWIYDDGPTPLRLVAQRGLSNEILADHRHPAARCPDGRDGRPPRARGPRPRRQARDDHPEAPGRLSRRRDPDDLLRPDRLPRHPARPARALPPDRARLDRPTRPSSPAPSRTTWRPPSATPGWPTRPGR